MPLAILYHGFGIRGYQHLKTQFKEGGGSGPIVKTKNKSFLRCMSLIMPLSFASDDKPHRA